MGPRRAASINGDDAMNANSPQILRAASADNKFIFARQAHTHSVELIKPTFTQKVIVNERLEYRVSAVRSGSFICAHCSAQLINYDWYGIDNSN